MIKTKTQNKTFVFLISLDLYLCITVYADYQFTLFCIVKTIIQVIQFLNCIPNLQPN